MNKAIGRDAALPPPRGRRIPSVGSGKDKGEDRPNARDLLATVNSASEGAAATWIAFLGTMAYLAVTLGGVTHVDLLLNNDTTLPFVNVKGPLATFFVMAPLAFVLVHFSLLLQHVMLSRKLGALEARLEMEEPSRDRSTQHIRDELHSYTFTQVASGKPKGAVVDMAQRLVVSLSLVVFPLLLLTFFQIGFLPYHSEPITWWHRGMLILDALVVWLLARHLARLDPASETRLTDWWRATSKFKRELIAGWHRGLDRAWSAFVSPTSLGARLARPMFAVARRGGGSLIRAIAPTRLAIVGLILFSTCVATLPDDHLDRATAWVARNWLPGLSEPLPYCREIVDDTVTPSNATAKDEKKDRGQTSKTKRAGTEPGSSERYENEKKCPPVTDATRHAFYPTAYLFEHKLDITSGKSGNLLGWSRNLVVTDKDLSAGDDEKKEKRISLRGRDLRYATLDRSKLKRADFYGARLAGARLSQADLNAANFWTAQLQGAYLGRAQLQGADLTEARLQGANLFAAQLQGAKLFGAQLQGAYLFLAQLQGAELSKAQLQGAILTWANLQGADLSEYDVQGATPSAVQRPGTILTGVQLQGAYLFLAQLQGADLFMAKLQGADLTWANLEGADFSGATLQGTDLSGAALQGADLSGAAVWRTNVVKMHDYLWSRVSAAGMKIGPPGDSQRKALAKAIAGLEKMAKEGAAGRTRVRDGAKRVGDRLRPLLEPEGDEKWRGDSDLGAWCQLAERPSPDPAELAAQLGKLACDDDTDKAYMAQGLVTRTLSGSRLKLLGGGAEDKTGRLP